MNGARKRGTFSSFEHNYVAAAINAIVLQLLLSRTSSVQDAHRLSITLARNRGAVVTASDLHLRGVCCDYFTITTVPS